MMGAMHLVKRQFKGISWQHPLINGVFHAIDPIDALARRMNGLGYLPPYSVRVRSNGVNKQFGGRIFKYYGDLLRQLLEQHAALTANDCVLEIGCGCGRIAYALTEVLADGNYLGVDIDRLSLEACEKSKLLSEKRFRFDRLDVHNKAWNPEATQQASSYVFPYMDTSFDMIFLISVFTHMLPSEVQNYIQEMSRMLKPQGRVFVSAFLMDYGNMTNGLSFPYKQEHCYLHEKNIPEKAVGYSSAYLIEEFAKYQLSLMTKPLLGRWRQFPNIRPSTDFGQDILVFHKQPSE